MSELKLLETNPKPLHWKKERVNYFLVSFQNNTGKRCPLVYGMLMNLITKFAEEKWSFVDEESGEIQFEIPPIDEWKEQVDGFFMDEFAAKNCGYHFSYLLKQYGRFVKFIPNTKTQQAESKPITFYCPKCKTNVSQDHWCE